MEESFKELQLLPTRRPSSPQTHPWPSDSSSLRYRSSSTVDHLVERPSLDLQLSISLRPIKAKQPMPTPRNAHKPQASAGDMNVEAVRWHASEQIKMATAEKAYAERVREMTRREMEMAQSEFARARQVWERAREEVDRVERLKEKSTTRIGSTCLEITCHSCRQKFQT